MTILSSFFFAFMYFKTFFFPWNTKEVIYSRSVLSHNKSEWDCSCQARYKSYMASKDL